MTTPSNSSLIVQKFGGTSVGTPDRIRAIAERIAQTRNQGKKIVVVVSAMGNMTDELIHLANQVTTDPPHREMDMLLSAGERISMSLLSMALTERGVPAISLTGSQSGIITDDSHRRARILRIHDHRVKEGLNDNRVVIVAGFQGVSEKKEITTLGRGGSDTSAVALAATLEASLCEIYTDVDGIFSADPNIVQNATLLKTVTFDIMVEMAVRGAKILHPRSVEIASRFGVPLVVRNSFHDKEGTRIMLKHDGGLEKVSVTAVVSDLEKSFVHVTLSRPSTIASIWFRAAEAKLSVLAPYFQKNDVTFFIETESEKEWKTCLTDLTTQGFIKTVDFDSNLIPVSLIGRHFSQDSQIFYQALDLLAENEIQVSCGNASTFAITFAVPKRSEQDCLRIFHRAFLEKPATGKIEK